LKLNQQGILINSYKNKKIPTSKLEALNSNPIDVAGAGDSLLIATTLALCSGGNIYESSYIGSIAAALQVGQTGNLPLKKKSLLKEIEECKHLF
jgi:bifunctional ADP-heptose synthase (sugar kinase/adenylyltransferase)